MHLEKTTNKTEIKNIKTQAALFFSRSSPGTDVNRSAISWAIEIELMLTDIAVWRSKKGLLHSRVNQLLLGRLEKGEQQGVCTGHTLTHSVWRLNCAQC